MNLAEYTNKIINAAQEDWTMITCWGFGSGPSYLQNMSVWTSGRSEFAGMEVEDHGMRASLKNDLSISIAWGFPSNPDFREPWANQFPDPSASSSFIDMFYNNVLVFRDVYVSVDGGRCRLPLPDRVFDDATNKVVKYTVPRDKYAFFRMIDGLERKSDFDRYFKNAKFEIVDEPWMV